IGEINSNAFFDKVIFFGNATISGNNSFDTLFFNNPGNLITLGSGSTQTINNELLENALPGFPVLMHSSSPGTQATISKSTGTICLNYFIMQDINATGGASFYAGDYSTDLGNNTGWSFTSCVPAISNVWPGDANYDLVCDNLDILNIGVAYNDTGYVRPGASLTWVAQPNLNWLSQFLSGVNAKHADCDGNGIVEALDTLAVSQNYGLTHPFRLSSSNNTTSAGIDLYFDMPAGSLVPGSSVSIPINFGTQPNPANNAYGIAFTINYSSALVQAGSMYVDYTGSWMATPANYIHLEKDFSATGNLDMGMCRINHQNVSGYGMIATLHFIVDNNASGLLTLSFSDVLAISNNEIQIPVNPLPGSVLTGMDEISAENGFTLYPNPVSSQLTVHSAQKISQVKISDPTGRIVFKEEFEPGNRMFNVQIDVSAFLTGIYFLSMEAGEKAYIKKVMIK
ncbi:MAG TPA: T9SS type A sorting domain-containing protein, partial [Bacteroidia bacterium]|nr:T9SS type A sorting domain-containing protein [Bacteroidia bacterium]